MTVTWIVESNVFAEVCYDEMIAKFKSDGIPYKVVQVKPMSSVGGVPEIIGKVPVVDVGPVVVYGSIGTQALARQNGWDPGVWTDDVNFNYETYRDKLGDLLLNADMIRMPLSKVDAYLRKTYPSDANDSIFIKPNLDTKEFPGQVISIHDFNVWLCGMIDTGYLNKDHDFDVVISRPKKLGVEWRAVVVNGKVSSCSIYRQWQKVMPERHILPEVEDLIMQAQAKWEPAPVYVIDIAQEYVIVDGVEDYVFKVIEYNTFNSAGLYACDPAKIIDDINDYVRISHARAQIASGDYIEDADLDNFLDGLTIDERVEEIGAVLENARDDLKGLKGLTGDDATAFLQKLREDAFKKYPPVEGG